MLFNGTRQCKDKQGLKRTLFNGTRQCKDKHGFKRMLRLMGRDNAKTNKV